LRVLLARLVAPPPARPRPRPQPGFRRDGLRPEPPPAGDRRRRRDDRRLVLRRVDLHARTRAPEWGPRALPHGVRPSARRRRDVRRVGPRGRARRLLAPPGGPVAPGLA